jgi:hypothetical protein
MEEDRTSVFISPEIASGVFYCLGNISDCIVHNNILRSVLMKNSKAKFVAKVGVLAALASGLMILETPIPFMPTFLKLDISELIALLGSFSLGPMAPCLLT